MLEAMARIIDGLANRYRGRFSPDTIRDYVVTAEAELRGSIAAEAFPEMVVRLVSYRLDRAWDELDAAPQPEVGDVALVSSSR